MAMKRRKRKRNSKGATAAKIPVDAEKAAGPSAALADVDYVIDLGDELLAAVKEEKPTGSSVALPGADRRTHPRYKFIAAVEVVAAESGGRVETRVPDLSQQGCYADTNNALPLGTVTDIRITKRAQRFETRARAVHSRAGKGMGLVFTAIESQQLLTLETWLADSRQTSCLSAKRRRVHRG